LTESSTRHIKAAVTLGALAAVVIASGPGLFGEADFTAWHESWQKHLLSGTCHQAPGRSFELNGVPMAACSRCYGFYWGLLLAWPFFSFVPGYLQLRKTAVRLLIAALLIISIDVAFSIAGIWQNTLTSRFLTGLLLGSTLFSAIFFTGTDRMHNGTHRT
jgi:uncharacterized membrane protein